MMKIYQITIFFISIFGYDCAAQQRLSFILNQNPELIVDAGENQSLIVGESLTLGGSPSATGGDGNYSFAWFPADGLNDTTLSNPTTSPEEPITYTLTVSDGNNCSCTDTVEVAIITNLENDLVLNEFITYPNPASGTLNIKFNSSEILNAPIIKIINTEGRILYRRTLSKGNSIQESISVNFLARGVYFIQVEDEGRIASKKIIIR